MEEAPKQQQPQTWDWDPIVENLSDYYTAASYPILLSDNFVPPPPRPLFLLEEGATPDGLTTCDLCTWAFRPEELIKISLNTERAINSGGEVGHNQAAEVGWVLTLVIVSLVSAVVGAIIMIIFLHCRRLKNDTGVITAEAEGATRPPHPSPDAKLSIIAPQDFPTRYTLENHYTNMEDSLYAELDESRDNLDASAYRNSGYADADAPSSSAPSSAYYSDLSCNNNSNSGGERAYEVVGMVNFSWDGGRLEAISENRGDYV